MRRTLVALVALLAVAGAGAGVWWQAVGQPQARQRAAAATVDAFLQSWEDGDWPALAARITPRRRQEALRTHQEAFAHLDVEGFGLEPLDVHVDGEVAEARYRARLDVEGLGRHTYEGSFRLDWAGDAWTVAWSPQLVHPAMVAGGTLVTSRTWPERAAILDRDGVPLVGTEDAVSVGIEPRRVTDREVVVEALVDHAGASRQRVEALLDRDDLVEDWFYPVVDLPRSLFDEADPDLRPVPGIVFRAGGESRGGPSAGFAVHLLGRTGGASAEQAAQLGAPYREGDVVGLYGLEEGLEEQLAGTPALRLEVVDGGGEVVEVLVDVPATEPEPVRVTLDRRVQAAAEGALAGDGPPAAVVAVDVDTGDVLAAANRPVGGYNRAFEGRYPPGSTFKIVTAGALLGRGVRPEDPLDCPETVQVGGRSFRNAGDLALGEVSLTEAFARSCNTAFAGQAVALGDDLVRAAEAFGFDGRAWLPLPSFGGSFPEPADATELAAAAIGQGRVEASPLHMATVAAAAARGAWQPPRLVLGDAAATDEVRALPAGAGALPGLMREVVTGGTGAAAELEGEPVAGKTGSAEFGTASPPDTHAWFVGFRGDVAFAVLVEGGGAGADVAAPLARTFLEALQ